MASTVICLRFADGFRAVRRNLDVSRIDAEACRIRPGVELVEWTLGIEGDLFETETEAREACLVQGSLF